MVNVQITVGESRFRFILSRLMACLNEEKRASVESETYSMQVSAVTELRAKAWYYAIWIRNAALGLGQQTEKWKIRIHRYTPNIPTQFRLEGRVLTA